MGGPGLSKAGDVLEQYASEQVPGDGVVVVVGLLLDLRHQYATSLHLDA